MYIFLITFFDLLELQGFLFYGKCTCLSHEVQGIKPSDPYEIFTATLATLI